MISVWVFRFDASVVKILRSKDDLELLESMLAVNLTDTDTNDGKIHPTKSISIPIKLVAKL